MKREQMPHVRRKNALCEQRDLIFIFLSAGGHGARGASGESERKQAQNSEEFVKPEKSGTLTRI
jgi:hypothetical protein